MKYLYNLQFNPSYQQIAITYAGKEFIPERTYFSFHTKEQAAQVFSLPTSPLSGGFLSPLSFDNLTAF